MNDNEYVDWLRTYVDWYESAVGKWWALLIICRMIVFISTVLAAFLAVLINKENLSELKWVTAGLALFGAGATNLLAEFKVAKMEALREEGRLESEHLTTYARDKLEEYKDDPEKRFRIKDEVRARLRRMELQQGREFAQVFHDSPRGVTADSNL